MFLVRSGGCRNLVCRTVVGCPLSYENLLDDQNVGDKMTGKKILLIVDNDALNRSLVEQLQLHDEFVVAPMDTAAAALEVVKTDNFDLILLDADLPDLDGGETCRIFRQAAGNTPIVMLTMIASETDGTSSLDVGADDYIVKPFRLGDLLARLRSQIRRYEQCEDVELSIGPFTFQPNAKLLLNETQNSKIRLTEKETAILKYLYRAGDKPVGRAKLLDEVWKYNAGVTTHTLETHVYRLRQKLELDPSNAQILVTEPGGYRLIP